MADQKLSPQGSPAKNEIRTKPGSGKRAVIYTCISTGGQSRRNTALRPARTGEAAPI
jgi:hypothetical protein